MHNEPSGYGLWSLVIINSLVFIIFAFSFARPQNARDWRAFGAFSAFLVALFTDTSVACADSATATTSVYGSV